MFLVWPKALRSDLKTASIARFDDNGIAHSAVLGRLCRETYTCCCHFVHTAVRPPSYRVCTCLASKPCAVTSVASRNIVVACTTDP